MTIETPWIINVDELEKLLDDSKVVVVDVSTKDSYALNHIPGAVFFDYASLVKHKPPVMGMLADAEQLSQALSSHGIQPDDYLVVYDEEGGGKAGRFMWTLEIAGHKKMSLLDGGIVAWAAAGKAISQTHFERAASEYPMELTDFSGVANADYILEHLNDDSVKVLDTRSANEFAGIDVRGPRGGHIPGAANIDWLAFKDSNTQKLNTRESIEALLQQAGIKKSDEVIVHCHSHHRSALVYVALKHLGYDKVKGYPASWSDWASRTDTPIEI
ncbi:MAG: sulfurtransferase [Gammaproteobacteria bacterium]|nr:sulfurtransferase [Gammaproteobacteria bacterium]